MIATTEDHNGIRLIRCGGRATIGSGDAEIRNLVNAAIAAGARGVVLDFYELASIDSSGIGELVGSYTTAMKRRVMFALSRPTPKLDDIFIETELRTVLPVFSTPEEAVATLSAMTFETYIQTSANWTSSGPATGA